MLDLDDSAEERMTTYHVAVYLPGRTPRVYAFDRPSEAGRFAEVQQALGRRFKAFTRVFALRHRRKGPNPHEVN